MNLNQVAAQLYTVRDHLKTPEDLLESLKRIKSIGYTAAQLSGQGPMDMETIRDIFAESGVACVSTHHPSQMILDNPEQVADELAILGCTSVAYPYPGGYDFGDPDSVARLTRSLDAAGAVLAGRGVELSYHNHHLEFRRIGDATALDFIYDNTDPAHLVAELDTYWVQAGGGSVEAWCRRMTGRLPLIHLKDFGLDEENQACFEEIGRGNLDFPGIIAAAEAAGCKLFIVEQDRNWEAGDPFRSLEMSFAYIRDRLVDR